VLRRIMHVHRPGHSLLMEAGLTELGLEEPPGSSTAPGVPVPGLLRIGKGGEAGNAEDSLADPGQCDSMPLRPCRAIWASPRAPTTDL
jgi:hypothetical protein